jgi:hypothetical protein
LRARNPCLKADPDRSNPILKLSTMKTTCFIRNALGLGTILALAGSLGPSAFAGPGPQYWQQMQLHQDQATATTSVAAPAKTAPNAGCSKCETQVVQQFSAGNVSGKSAQHSSTVGAKHTCANCGGTITTINGKTSNQMMENCPVCGKTSPNCCMTKT